MSLSPAQLTALKAAVATNAATIPAGQDWTGGYAGQAINTLPVGVGSAAAAVAGWYSQVASPSYLCWKTDADIAAIRAAVTLANFTPADAVPASPSTDLTFSNRAFICQLKQANALFIVQQQGTLDGSSVNLRQSFLDCLRAIPSGAGGANQDAGWGAPANPGAVRLALQRQALFIEKLYSVAGSGPGNTGADARGSATNPDLFVWQGPIGFQDVLNAWAS